MTATTFIGHFLGPDTHANRPAATGLANGTLYVCTTDNKIERVVSGAWVDYATLGSGAAAGAMTLLSTTTLGADGTFDVSSIAGTYNDLIVMLIARSTLAGTTDAPIVRFNNDSGTNYYAQRVRQIGTTAPDGTEVRTATSFPGGLAYIPASTAMANAFGILTITIGGYASTTWLKDCLWDNHAPFATAASSQNLVHGAGWWNSTAAINRIQVQNGSGGNLLAGSQLRIYGRT